ncbi:MAG: class I SAM-dependent methyltransferase [Deltaproteobacteria bacterium]|nr:class I SAM-dependent methyltransferase [Deltaproteobacteria bacterium]
MSFNTEDKTVEMEEDAEFQRQLNLFVRSSTEKGIELVKIGESIAALPRRRSFLDIGAGGGDLTIPVSQSFDETTIVEPNEKQAHFFRRRCPHFKIYDDYWEKVDLAAKRFDFILCSHVLYYIPEGRWVETIEKMHAHLEPGGRIAIVLQSPLGEVARFFNQFTRYDVNILELWGDLIRKYGDEAIEVRYFMNEIWTDSLDDMVTIALFLLIDRRFRDYEEGIRRYIESHHKVADGYRIMQDEILLLIKKTSEE